MHEKIVPCERMPGEKREDSSHKENREVQI